MSSPIPGARYKDPYLIKQGQPKGKLYRTKRAIIRFEQVDAELQANIRELKAENAKLKEKLIRLRKRAAETDEIEDQYEQLSQVIMESRMTELSSFK
ncbi:hypothetical protein TVAG_339640 [Trichomonas vaginalis G3]|uniref:Uncharacterized protein n=1 Tax=Trichomonas vaginalis (strain ATCC PRA-98 / G3) TaxID=412133 RepID=A2G882_TRIV3|nr:hypothetical protein TVAGG3_0195330 [Trichomonas vaginalis G3]EAX86638.1 hypothetical protein TVAG_339640 [Trichomonas vaginalis G3]KAI5550262.1 hypothetical protein TVAGG3_0195330 [Trichomonas vaginalis G3]|eukprot:XP_001299568.1 hypothetical protein [Trichomonas vaginalis G3]